MHIIRIQLKEKWNRNHFHWNSNKTCFFLLRLQMFNLNSFLPFNVSLFCDLIESISHLLHLLWYVTFFIELRLTPFEKLNKTDEQLRVGLLCVLNNLFVANKFCLHTCWFFFFVVLRWEIVFELNQPFKRN